MIVPYNAHTLAQACMLLQQENVCAFPTETVYGLGGNAWSSQAIQRIYHLKGRPTTNPLIVHIHQTEQVHELAQGWTLYGEELAASHWPGPLTLVLARNPRVPALVSAGMPTVALRMPAHPIALDLLRTSGLPLCAPSANRSEHISPTTAQHVLRSLPHVPLILDGGPCRLGIESTVVDLTTSPPRLLRPGALSVSALQKTIPHLQLLAIEDALDTLEPRTSPGLMKRHYAPQVPTWLVETPNALQEAVHTLNNPGVITHHPWHLPAGVQAYVEHLSDEPVGYAADLYAALHRLESAGVSAIVIEKPPTHKRWLAIQDRLLRASLPWTQR